MKSNSIREHYGAMNGPIFLSTRRQPNEDGAQVPLSLAFKNLKPFIERHLGDMHNIALNYRTESGSLTHGIKVDEATGYQRVRASDALAQK